MSKSIQEIESEMKNEIYDLLSKGDENIRARIIEIHKDMENEHDELCTRINSGQLQGPDAARLINESIFSSLKKMADVVGADAVKEVFDVDLNEPFQLVDPNLMDD